MKKTHLVHDLLLLTLVHALKGEKLYGLLFASLQFNSKKCELAKFLQDQSCNYEHTALKNGECFDQNYY
jgi:hypothetical protein